MVKPKWIFHLCRKCFYRGLHMTLLECRDTKLWPVFGPCVDENLSLLWRSAGGRANYKCKDTNEKDQRTSFNSMSIPSIAGPSRKSTLWATPAFTMNGAPISYASLSMSSAITCTRPDHQSWVAATHAWVVLTTLTNDEIHIIVKVTNTWNIFYNIDKKLIRHSL
jgi:hypothetical protein